MRRLLPEGPDVTDLTTLEGLAEAYAYPEATDRGVPWLRANMVSSLDGAARLDGLSEGLSSEADKRIFGVLRALADVVVVGAQTVRAEGYRPARARAGFAAARSARGQTPAATIAVVSTRLDLDLDAPLFTEPLTPTLVITCGAAPAAALKAAEQAAEVVLAGDERVDPVALVRVLAERGWTRLLTEGGPSLLGQLAAAGVLDELCLSLAPLLAAGDAPRISHGPTAAAGRMELVSLLEEKGFLFARYARSVKSAG
ncbi:pyrimidine reductase family protein [Streptacidiphilus sp. EB129]|uniref:pyrimidine reductase family protein n=1 Tax=Streptacidiphilus sp. EB129 TaxID=3156262 RepID=UPI003515BCEC